MKSALNTQINLYVKHTKFTMAKMVRSPVESKTTKPRFNEDRPMDPPESVIYYQAPLMYEYEFVNSEGKPCTVTAPLQVEGPIITSNIGLIEQIHYGRSMIRLPAYLDMSNAETASSFKPYNFVSTDPSTGFWEQLYYWCVSFLFTSRDSILPFRRLTRVEALQGFLKYPVEIIRDQNTGAPIPGKNPFCFFNVMAYGKKDSISRCEASFKYPTVKEGETKATPEITWENLNWDFLKNVILTIRPMFTFKSINVSGGRAYIIFEITSAVVLSIINKTQDLQAETMKELAMNKVYLANIISQTTTLFKSRAKLHEEKEEKVIFSETAPTLPLVDVASSTLKTADDNITPSAVLRVSPILSGVNT